MFQLFPLKKQLLKKELKRDQFANEFSMIRTQRVSSKQADFFEEMLISTNSFGSQYQEEKWSPRVKIHDKGYTLSALTSLLEESECFSPLIMEKH